MYKKLTVLSAIVLCSTSALAGGEHEPYNTNYNNNNTSNSSNLTIHDHPAYFYTGAEGGWLHSEEDFWTIAPLVGLRVGKHFGLEASYTWSTSEDVAAGVDTDVSTLALDAIGYLPISDDNRLELVGLVGVGRYDTDNSAGNNDDTALRYGGGLQYEIDNNWSGRVLYRRAELDTALLEDADTVTLGFTYNFK